MLNIFGKFFDSNEKEISKLSSLIEEINSLEQKIKKLKDADFPQKTKELKERVEDGEPLENIMAQAFALVREASVRTLGLRHFDVQLMAAASLAFGKIAEQKT